MTDIEVLERAEAYVGVHYINGEDEAYIYPMLKQAISAGIAALRAQLEQEKNEPLTLEELREMADPVWCSCDIPGGGFWCLCNNGIITAPSANVFNCELIPDWKLYRRKTEERRL